MQNFSNQYGNVQEIGIGQLASLYDYPWNSGINQPFGAFVVGAQPPMFNPQCPVLQLQQPGEAIKLASTNPAVCNYGFLRDNRSPRDAFWHSMLANGNIAFDMLKKGKRKGEIKCCNGGLGL